MSGMIRVTPDELERVASQYNHEGGNLEELLGRIDQLMENLEGVWDGEAKVAFFVNKYRLKAHAF